MSTMLAIVSVNGHVGKENLHIIMMFM